MTRKSRTKTRAIDLISLIEASRQRANRLVRLVARGRCGVCTKKPWDCRCR